MKSNNSAATVSRRLSLVAIASLFSSALAAPALAQDWTSTQVGGFTFHNSTEGVSGTSTQIGDFTFHDFSNGLSGTSTQIGDFGFHNFSNGTSCTTTNIGIFSFTNCN